MKIALLGARPRSGRSTEVIRATTTAAANDVTHRRLRHGEQKQRHAAMRLTRLRSWPRPHGRSHRMLSPRSRCVASPVRRCPPPSVPEPRLPAHYGHFLAARRRGPSIAIARRGTISKIGVNTMRIARVAVFGAMFLALTPAVGAAQDDRQFISTSAAVRRSTSATSARSSPLAGAPRSASPSSQRPTRFPVRVRLSLVQHR